MAEETHHQRMLAHLHRGTEHLGTHHQAIKSLLKEYIEVNGITSLPDTDPNAEV